MENYRPLPGTSVEELDTPCLLVDMDALEHNLRVAAQSYRNTRCKMRAHTKNHKSPMLAWMQIRTGGTVGGVCTAKTAEAEVMVEGGITDVFITNQVVTREKIARLCSLARHADIKVAIDDPGNLQMLSQGAMEAGITIGVIIEVNTSMGRAGIRRVEQGVQLARLAESLPGIAFKGVMSHQSLPGSRPDRETRMIRGSEYIQVCLDVAKAIEEAGIRVEVVSTGESWTYDVAAQIPGVTEVQGGTYALMSASYTYMDEFQVAAKILGTIISTPSRELAIGDVGLRAVGSPKGLLPCVEGMAGVTLESLNETHIVLRTDGTTPLNVGDHFLLQSGQQDIMVNRWDQFIAVRKGKVEAVWPIPGRGCHN